MFRGLFLLYLEKAFAAGALNFFSEHRQLHEPAAFRRYLAPVWSTEWVVYAKRPFAGPAQVLDYVGRYTHRVAISNNRLVSMDNGKVSFRWKDYRDGNRQKTMTLDGGEFIRRFLIHVLPDGFHRIRYYGFLGNCHRARKLARCRELLAMAPAGPAADPPADYRDRYEALTGRSLRAWAQHIPWDVRDLKRIQDDRPAIDHEVRPNVAVWRSKSTGGHQRHDNATGGLSELVRLNHHDKRDDAFALAGIAMNIELVRHQSSPNSSASEPYVATKTLFAAT